MPAPNAIGTHGNRRPGPASARTQSRNLPRIAGHASRPDGATPPARMASRGGQVAVRPRAGALFRSAIPVALVYAAASTMLPEVATSPMAILYIAYPSMQLGRE